MKIRQFKVKNYRSLQEVSLENIGDLAIFIGPNSSGKSNLLEALLLFFNEIDPAVERNIGAIDEYVWFDRYPEHPVEFEVTLELTKDEVSEFLPSELLERIQVADSNALSVLRSISGKPKTALWRTESVRLNGTPLIENRKFVFAIEKETTEPSQPKAPPAEYLGPILQSISQSLKGKFKLISAARNNPFTPSGYSMRSSFLPAAVLGDLTTLGQPIGRPREDEKTWIAIDDKVRRTCKDIIDVRVMSNRLTIREKESDMFFPIEATGGGYQEVMGLACQLLKEADVFLGVEEPEVHLHPELARKFFGILKEISKQNQVFITTHSTVFMDQAELQNTWVVRKINKHTVATRLSQPKDLRNVLHELGLRPSDVFYSNGVIFVEGPTDKVVFSIWARSMGINFEEFGISVVPTYGKASGRYHLTVWTDATENTGIPYYLILDKGAEKETKKLLKKLTYGENLFLLKKEAIEEYYPVERIVEALKQEYDIAVDEEEKKMLVPPMDKAIEKLISLKKKDATGWKVAIGRIVAESMPLEEIDDEIKGILERIHTNLVRERTL
jgi:ABC-type Mn2+/Zn2+ transport system ATPase subunit